MKNRVFILSFLISMISVNFVFAQTSTKKLSYQAVVRNAANELVVNQNLAVEITVLDAGNAPQYRETHPSVPTNQNGLLWLWVGEGTPTLGTMADVVWKEAVIRSVFTLPDGSTVTQNTPVTAMPHAFFADEVDTVFLQNYLDTHDVVPDNYVTHPQLNDTLGHYFDSTQVKSAIHDTANAIRAAIPASQVNADWNATDGPAEILNKPDLSVYATNAHLNDTLNSFATKGTLSAYATKDTLANYATTNALKDSLSRYVGKDKLNDTLDSYYTKNNIDSKLNDYEKKSELCGDVKECIKDTLGKYTTTNQIDTLLGAYYDSTQVKSAIHDTANAIRAAIPASQVNADWNATDGPAEILNKPDLSVYATNAHLNDTLNSFATKDTLNSFATKDTLAHYASTNALKDSLTRYVDNDKLNDTLDSYYTKNNIDNKLNDYEKKSELCGEVKDCIKDTLGKYTTSDNIDTLLGAYYDSTQVKSAIHDTADAIRAAIPASQVNADWNAPGGPAEILNKPDLSVYATNAHLNDTLNSFATKDTLSAYATKDTLAHYASTNALKDSLTRYVDKDKLTDTLDSYYTKNNIDNKLNDYEKKSELCGDVKECIKDTLGKYTTSDNIDTLLGAYYDSTQVKTAIHDTADAIRAAIPASQVNADWNATGGPAEILNKPDLSVYATNAHLNDTLNSFATKDTLSAYATKDTLKNFLTINGLCDSIVKCDVIKDMRDSLDNAFDTLGHYTTTNQIDTLLDNYLTIEGLCDSIENNCTNVALKNKDNLFTYRNQFDSTVFFKNETQFDSIAYFNERTYFDKDVNIDGDVIFKGYNYYYNVNNFYEHGAIVLIDEAVNPNTLGPVQSTQDQNLNRRLAVNYNDLMVVYDTLKKTAQSGNAALAARIVADSNRLVEFKGKVHNDSLTLAEKIRSDSVTVMDTLHTYYATKDTLKNFVNKLVIRDSVNKVVTDSLRKGPSEMTRAIDSIARHHISDSTRMVFDTLHTYYATKDTLKNFVNKLAIRDSVNKVVTDSLRKGPSEMTRAIDSIARHHVSDSTRMVFDTLHKYYATKDTLKNFVNKDVLCTEVMACTDIKHMRDSIQKVNARLTLDSTKLAERIHDDSLLLAQKIRTDSFALVNRIVADSSALVNRIVADSTALATKEKADSSYLKGLIDNIPLANDKTITITTNGNSTGVTNGVFTLNQSTDQTIDIAVPTKLSQLINDGGMYAKRDSVNVFTENNAFTDTVTVPNGYVLRGENATNESNCGNIVVNACDLWAVFDSLDRRMKSLEDNLSALKSAFKPTTISQFNINNRTKNSIRVQVTASNPVFDISGYEFCCLNCGDGSTPVCTTSTSNQYTFNGLTPYTDYNFTVKAMTFADTVESSVSGKTKAETPSAISSVTALPIPQAGFRVDLSEIDLKGMPSGTVKVAYKLATASNYGNETTANIDALTSTYSKTVASLASNTQYNVRIVISNGDADTTFVETVTTGDAVTLTITRMFPGNGNLNNCKVGNKSFKTYVLLKATPSSGNSEDYTYVWTTTGGTEITTTNNSYFLIEQSLGSKKSTTRDTVRCTATTKASPNVSLDPVAHVIVFKKTTDENFHITDFPEFSKVVNNHTVTLEAPWGGEPAFNTQWVAWKVDSVPVFVPDGNYPICTYGNYGTYAISAYSEDGCRIDSSVTIAPSVNITSDHGSDIGFCGASEVQVTYTAEVETGVDVDSYSWSVDGTPVSSTQTTCTVTYTTTGTHTVSCTATIGTLNVVGQTNTTVTSGTYPSFTFCVSGNNVELRSAANVVSPSYLDWGDGHIDPNPMYVPNYYISSNAYTKDSIYTITLTNNYGCKTTKTAIIGNISPRPCSVASPHTDYTGGGFNGADDGKETVVDGKVTSVTDYDGNIYPVVEIGNQCWLAENMRCMHSPSHDDGTSILNPDNLSGNHASGRKGSQAAQWYENNSAYASKGYGLLYNWCAAVDTFNAAAGATIHTEAGVWWGCNFEGNRRGICPKGWHVPTVDEWTQMESYVNGSEVDHSTANNYVGTEAGKLSKSCEWSGSHSDPSYPNSYSDENRNESGFGAIPAGYTQYSSGYNFGGTGSFACFWTATKYASDNSFRYIRKISKDSVGVQNPWPQMTQQYSVRCVRD